MKATIVPSCLVGFCFLMPGGLFGGDANRAMEAELKMARNEVKALWDAEDYTTLVALSTRWASLSPDIQKHIVVALLRSLQSGKQLNLGGSPRVVVSGVSDVKKDDKKIVVLTRDVYCEGGRAAWAIEELIPYCGLPRLGVAKTEEEKNRVQQESYEAVIRAMDVPIGLFIDVSKLSEEKRAILAANERTPEAMLARLAKDPSANVRRTVAENKSTPFRILSGLITDSDPQVESAAWKSVARRGAGPPLPK